jgi:Family of unknown function (DUF6084)
MPDLDFRVIDAEALPFAAGPTMLFKLHIGNATAGEHIHSIMLRVQIRIEATRRQYDAGTEERLLELFGEPSRWGETLRSMLWTHTTAIVQHFDESAVAELPVPCTYDFDVVGAKYFYALKDGDVPLLFLFSGTIFYSVGDGPLQIAQVSWEKEAQFRLPIQAWKDMMDSYFPNSTWLRLQKDVFDQLNRYKARRALPTWEATFEELLRHSAAELER